MITMLRYFTMFALVLLASCGKNDVAEDVNKDDFISRMAGEPYVGSAKSTLHLHGYETLPSANGTGSFHVSHTAGDSVTLALICNLSGGDGFNFGIPGKQSGAAWSADFSNGGFAIDPRGAISGLTQREDQELSWNGHLFDDRLMLDVRIKYLKQEGSITAGSIIHTHLDLVRSRGDNSATPNGCSIVVWETRPVFNLYGGGVDLIQVPVCRE